MKRKRTPRSRGTAQLDGALALLGGRNKVAGYDKDAFVRRAGELIARAACEPKLATKLVAKPARKAVKRGTV